MPEAERLNQQKRSERPAAPRGWKHFGSLVMTFGLAAMITSSFGLGEIYATGRQRSHEQGCSIAQRIVLGDSMNPALSEQQRMGLALLALHRVRHCLGDQS
ncbi:MAG TPA: hypothetical protein VN231_03195 [Allosphingosinicella sp.]|nr:hypothetical protein [Allosphingosinicella sp.]